MLDPTSDEAYRWPADTFARRWVADYDQAHPENGIRPFEVVDLSPYTGFVQRFICGIAPGDIDIDEIRADVIWQIPTPMTIETRVIDPDLLEILFGQPVVPLCARQLPERGTE